MEIMTEVIRDMEDSPRRNNVQIISIPGGKRADGGGINNQSNNLQLPDLKKDQKGLLIVR